jgi:hypothetical protein
LFHSENEQEECQEKIAQQFPIAAQNSDVGGDYCAMPEWLEKWITDGNQRIIKIEDLDFE